MHVAWDSLLCLKRVYDKVVKIDRRVFSVVIII